MQTAPKIAMSLLLAFAFPTLRPPLHAQGVHPGFTITSLRPPGFDPQVSGLDFLPDGRLVVSTWEGFGATKGSVYLVSNAQSGDASKITYAKFAGNLNEPLGVKVVDGEIYLLQKDQLSWLPDKDKNGVADEVKKVGSGWTVQPGSKNLEFAMGMVYRDSVFYAGLAVAYPYESKQSAERGCIIQISTKTGGFQPYACGTRTPDGMVLGPDDELFVTENQGNWVPSSKLLHVKKGRFFNVHKPNASGPGPFDSAPVTPPVLWLDHGAIGISPTQPAFLKTGVYQGQMIAGDANLGTLQRYFLEKVGGEYEGCVFRFTGGMEAAVHRAIVGPDGAVYLGGIGTPEWGGWDWNGKDYGLQRMVPNGKKVFDLLSVRSTGPATMQLEFTAPVGTGADKAANYKAQQWAYIPKVDYGAGKQPVENLTVQSATVSADKMKVTLEIPGMKVKDVIYLKLGAVQAADNSASWSTEAWYTLNAIGPGTDVTVSARPQPRAAMALAPMEIRALGAGKIAMKISTRGPFTLDVLDPQGRVRESRQGSGPMELISNHGLEPGLYILSLKASGLTSLQRVVCP